MADERTFHLRIISPNRVFYEGDVQMLEINTTEGEIGILKNHIPLTSVLAPGVCFIHETEEEIKVAAVHSGFIEVLQDQVTVLAETAEWPNEIDVNRADESRIRAERRLQENPMGTNIARATLSLKRSAARIEAAKR